MKRMVPLVQRFAADQRGATAIEYCLIAGFISIAIAAAATQIGLSVKSLLEGASPGLQ